MHSLIKNNIYADFIILDSLEVLRKKLSNFVFKQKKSIQPTKWKKIIKKNNKDKIHIERQTIGLVGKRPDGFDTCDFSSSEIKNTLNYNIKKFHLRSYFNNPKKLIKKKLIQLEIKLIKI